MTTSTEIVTTGDELLRGEVVNTNATWLAEQLGEQGILVQRIVTVGDNQRELEDALKEAAARCQLLLVSGGLGPTEDDRTREAVAQISRQALEVDPAALEELRRRFARSGYPFTPNNAKQALLPKGALTLANSRGTAPGFRLQLGACHLFCLPGVPAELKAMFSEQVAPVLERELALGPALVRTLNIFGLGESQIDHRLQGLLAAEEQTGCKVTLHFRTAFPINRVVLVVRPQGASPQARTVIDRLEGEVRRRLAGHVVGLQPIDLPTAVVQGLQRAGASLALAESCTGGLLGDLVTSVPGSSEVFQLGLVTYADAFKRTLLQVPAKVLASAGAVSPECVAAMARGARRLAQSTYGLAVSGVAGPGGGSVDKPVGTVHFALDSAAGSRLLHRVFPFDRQHNKLMAAHVALALVLAALDPQGPADPLAGRFAPPAEGAKESR